MTNPKSFRLSQDLTISANQILHIGSGETLNIRDDYTLTNNGTIIITQQGLLNVSPYQHKFINNGNIQLVDGGRVD
jgi:hypothetical protein